MKRFDLGDLGAPRRSKALKTQLCDSDPSEHQKTSYTYAKTRKRLFVTFLFSGKLKIIRFFPEQSAEGNYRLRCTPFRPKRSKSLKWRRWSSFRSKITQAALCHTCPTFLMVLGAPKRVWALKRVLEQLCTSAPQNHQETSDTYEKKRVLPRLANF